MPNPVDPATDPATHPDAAPSPQPLEPAADRAVATGPTGMAAGADRATGANAGPADETAPSDETAPTGAEAPEAPRGPTGSAPTRRRRLLFDAAAVGALLVFVAAFFWPLVTGHMFSTVGNAQDGIFPWAATQRGMPIAIQDDSATLSFGWQAFATSTLRAGTFPFWNPDNVGGYALFANGSSGFANPLRIALALAVKPFVAHELFSIAHLAAGGVLAYLLAKELRLRRFGALLAATAWMLSAWNLGWLHLEVVSPVIAFFPAGLLTVRRAVLRASLGWAALAAAVLAWLLVSTHLLFALVTWCLCLAYGAALALWPLVAPGALRDRRPRALVGRAARLAGTTLGSLGLAAPVLLPTWLMLSASQRTPLDYAELEATSLGEPSTFLHTFVPPDLPLDMGAFNRDLLFAGTLTALLGLVGLLLRGRPAAALGRGLAVGLFLVVIGTPLTWAVFTFVPGMDVFRPYTRLAMWWPLAVGLLGGAGLDAVLERVSPWRRWAAPALGVAVVGLTAVQLLDYGRDANPPFLPRDSQLLFPATPLVAAMQAQASSEVGWPNRYAGVRGPQDQGWSPSMMFANTNLVNGLDSIGGYDSAFPERVADVARLLTGEAPDAVLDTPLDAAYAPIIDVGAGRLDLLGRAGVSQVALVPGLVLDEPWAEPLLAVGATESYRGADGTLVVLPEAGPRLVGGTSEVATRRDALAAFAGEGWDHTATVLLEPDQAERLDGAPLPGEAGAAGRVLEASRGTNSARVVVEADRPAWLLVPDSWDPGWSAEVDGEGVPVLRADYYQRAVLVPEGRSEVTFRYRPEGLNAGVAVGLVSLALCGTGTLVSWRRRS